MQGFVETAFNESFSDPLDSRPTGIPCGYYALVLPAFVRFDWNLGPLHLARIDFTFAGQPK